MIDPLRSDLDKAAVTQAGGETRLHSAFMQAPVAMAIWRGPEHVLECANALFDRVLGARVAPGTTARAAFAKLDSLDAAGDSLLTRLDGVYATGEPSLVTELPAARGDGYALSVQPIRDAHGRIDGVLAIAVATPLTAAESSAAHDREDLLRRRARQADMSAEIAVALNESGDLRSVLNRCCGAVVEQLGVAFARVWTISLDGTTLELQASAGLYTHIDGPHARVPVGSFKIGLIAAERKPHLTNDVPHDPRVGNPEWAKKEGMQAFAGYPLMIDSRLVGVLAMFARHELPADTLEALSAAAQYIALGIERHRAEAAAALERRRMRDMFQQAAVGIALLRGPEHVFDSANPSYVEIAGGRPLLGLTVRQAFPEIGYSGLYEILDRVYASGEPFVARELPLTIVRGGQPTVIHINLTYQPLLDAVGRSEAILVVASEVTDMVRARIEIADSQERYRFLVDAVPNQVWTATPDGALDFVNGQIERYFGQPAATIVGQGWQAIIHPDDLATVVERWTHALTSGEPYEVEFRLRRRDGEYRWHIGRASAFRDGSGRIVKWFGSNVDVDETQRLMQALERSNQELDQFAYVASHDLKAPLRGIANLSQWIEEDAGPTLSGEAKQHMQLMRGRVNRMEALIDGILQYSRAGRVKEKLEQVDVGAMLTDIVELIQPKATARVVIPEELPRLKTERVPLQQVFMNLVGNALKHAGRVDPEVTIAARDAGLQWEFSVRDNGHGIDPVYHDRVWTIFQTLEARDKVEGTGIGLSVVKKIVESRGGRVAIDSAQGQGATFRFTWPKLTTLEADHG